MQKGIPPYQIINQMLEKGTIQNPKQAWATLEKWDDKGIINYGVSLDFAWLEQKYKSIDFSLVRKD